MKQFLLVFLFSSFFYNNETADASYLDFNELIAHADIVMFAKVVDQCGEKVGEDAVVQFEVQSEIKGQVNHDLYVNSNMLYQGDIPHSLKTLDNFSIDQDYLLFFEKDVESFTLLNQYTLKQVDLDKEELLIHIDKQIDHSDVLIYMKSNLLKAIEAFVYNETEILASEILVTE